MEKRTPRECLWQRTAYPVHLLPSPPKNKNTTCLYTIRTLFVVVAAGIKFRVVSCLW